MKNFFETKQEKITDKAFTQSLFISIASILICIVMLCSITFAWFSDDVSNNTNKAVTGRFKIEVQSIVHVEAEGDTEIGLNESSTYTLDEGKYRVTVDLTAETTVKGYCIITVNVTEYHTDVIVNDQTKNDIYNTPNAPFVFTLVIPEGGATVSFDSRWSIPADVEVTYGGTLTIPAE